MGSAPVELLGSDLSDLSRSWACHSSLVPPPWSWSKVSVCSPALLFPAEPSPPASLSLWRSVLLELAAVRVVLDPPCCRAWCGTHHLISRHRQRRLSGTSWGAVLWWQVFAALYRVPHIPVLLQCLACSFHRYPSMTQCSCPNRPSFWVKDGPWDCSPGCNQVCTYCSHAKPECARCRPRQAWSLRMWRWQFWGAERGPSWNPWTLPCADVTGWCYTALQCLAENASSCRFQLLCYQLRVIQAVGCADFLSLEDLVLVACFFCDGTYWLWSFHRFLSSAHCSEMVEFATV